MMTDQEREAHIKDCGRLMQKAYAEGNREEARQWMQAQAEAIRGRSPAQIARMEGCYFLARGEADRMAMGVTNA
jgi:uncharacterized protein (DUF2384 family)